MAHTEEAVEREQMAIIRVEKAVNMVVLVAILSKMALMEQILPMLPI